MPKPLSHAAQRVLAFAFGIDASVNPLLAMIAHEQIKTRFVVFLVFSTVCVTFAGILANDRAVMYCGLFAFTTVVSFATIKAGYLHTVDMLYRGRELNALVEGNVTYLAQVQSIEALYTVAHDALQAIADADLIREDGHCSHCGADLNNRPNPTDPEYHEDDCGLRYLAAMQEVLRKASEIYAQSQHVGVR